MNTIKKLFLLLCLIVVGVQSAWAFTYLGTVTVDGFTYYLYSGSSSNRYASLCGISGIGNADIPTSFVYDGYTYYVDYIGYWPDQEQTEDLTFDNIISMSLTGTSIYGNCSMPSLTTLATYSVTRYYGTNNSSVALVNCAWITGTLYAPKLKNVQGESLHVSGTLISDSLTYIDVPLQVGSKGKLVCPNLTTIDCKNGLPTFSEKASYSKVFTAPANTITAHVYDLPDKKIRELRENNVWCDFKEIINHKPYYNYTLVTTGGVEVSLLKLNGNVSYVSCNNMSLIGKVTTGSKSGSTKAGDSYAVEIKGVDPSSQIVTLWRNGFEVEELGETTVGGETVYFYDETDLQENVKYEVSIEYKPCEIYFQQEGYRGTIYYSRWINGETTTGAIYGNSATIQCAQGEQITLDIPYDRYKPQTLEFNGSTKNFTYENGRASVKIYAPRNTSAQAKLTWAQTELPVPQGETTHHYPQIMILRSGVGDVLFKGMAQPAEAQSVSYYVSEFGYPADAEGWVVSAVADCQDAVTTVTVPDVDLGRGGYLGESAWGFQMEIKPADGQGISRLMVGHITDDDNPYVEWEDFGNSSYLTPTNTGVYTFALMGATQEGYGAGDYIVNLVLGTPESAVETGRKLSFVRKGGRGDSYIAWNYDGPEPHFPFAEGSTSTTIPDEELQGNDLQMFVNTEEGETFHVYKDGMDISSQFLLNGQSTTQYWAPLEAKSASYTLLIEEAPDANPTWTVVQHDNIKGTQIVVNSAQGNETITCDYTKHELTIDDSNVTKVQLLVAASCVEGCIPVRVLKNGKDVSYQYSDYDGEVLTYEVPVAMLYNTTWDISYNTDLQQTFIIKGGGREPALTVEYEYLHGTPTLNFSSYGGPQSFYLPPFDEENNEEIKMKVFVNANEKATIFRNGNEVTGAFDPKTDTDGKYYELNVSDALFANNNTLSTLGFDIREAATWEITIEAACTDVHAYAAGGTVSMKKILADNSVEALGGGGSDCLRTLNDGEGVQIGFTPSVSGKELTKLIVSNSNVDLTNDSRLVKEADGNYTFTLTSEEIIALAGKKKEINAFAEFEGAVEKTGVDYMFIGDFAYIHAAVDGNGDVTYEGSDIEEENVVGYYIGKVVENGSGIGQQGCVEFKLPNATDTFRAYRDGVDMTHLFGKNDYDGMILFYADGLDDWMHEPSQWVIINESELVKYDVNRDHEINISDVTKLVNKIIGKE